MTVPLPHNSFYSSKLQLNVEKELEDSTVCLNTKRCSHNRIKSQCKECGGSEICPHNRQKTKCKECGGGSICIHNRIKYRCKECGGSEICLHDRRKSRCLACKAANPSGSKRCRYDETTCIEQSPIKKIKTELSGDD